MGGPASFALTSPVAAVAGVEATLIGAGLLGGLCTVALLFAVPGLRAEDGALSAQAAVPDPR